MKENKRFVHIASRVADAVSGLRYDRTWELARRFAGLIRHFEQLNTESRKLSVALNRRWLAAADHCRTCAGNRLNDLSYAISQVKKLTDTPLKKSATLSVIVDELRQLQDEFGDVEFQREESTLSVVTESITLEGIALGPFKIQLELNKLDQLYSSSPYLVIALEPNPAATDDSVTHPHVSSEKLCEGDGSAAIRAALEEGRICDFFTLVRSILNTYSPDSPYVALHDWDGATCYDCGYTMSSEDTYFCQSCEHDYCSECSTYCRRCEEAVCLGCSGQCSYCQEMLCRNCVSSCQECGESFCESCLKDDLCPDCQEEIEEQEQENERQEKTTNKPETISQPPKETTQVKLAG
ncbi:MAG: hypothetical protein ACYS74_01655 [Planctomycetota bacterium]|jgi:hypothetical protein